MHQLDLFAATTTHNPPFAGFAGFDPDRRLRTRLLDQGVPPHILLAAEADSFLEYSRFGLWFGRTVFLSGRAHPIGSASFNAPQCLWAGAAASRVAVLADDPVTGLLVAARSTTRPHLILAQDGFAPDPAAVACVTRCARIVLALRHDAYHDPRRVAQSWHHTILLHAPMSASADVTWEQVRRPRDLS